MLPWFCSNIAIYVLWYVFKKATPLLSTSFHFISRFFKVVTSFSFVISGIIVCLTRQRNDYISVYRKETNFESKCHLKASTKELNSTFVKSRSPFNPWLTLLLGNKLYWNHECLPMSPDMQSVDITSVNNNSLLLFSLWASNLPWRHET